MVLIMGTHLDRGWSTYPGRYTFSIAYHMLAVFFLQIRENFLLIGIILILYNSEFSVSDV